MQWFFLQGPQGVKGATGPPGTNGQPVRLHTEYEFVLLWNNRKLLHETENENDDSKLFSVHVRTSHHRRL